MFDVECLQNLLLLPAGSPAVGGQAWRYALRALSARVLTQAGHLSLFI